MIALLATAHAFNHIDTCNGNPTRWVNLPSVWRLQKPTGQNIYSGLTDAEVTAAVTGGFDVWENTTSCCSGFSHSNGGTTTTGFNTNDNLNVIRFETSNWNPQWGSVNSVIAFAVSPYFTNNCIISNADEVFNGVGFTFTVNNNPSFNQTDLQSISAHENGHWLGLDHSGVGQATMFASYSGGTGPRSLHADDEAGVCDSHPGACGPSESDCEDNIDNDGDGQIDCADPDCAAWGTCVCPLDGVVGCNNTITGNTTAQQNHVQSWTCANWATTGPERIYSFTPAGDGVVTVSLTGLSVDLDLFVTTESAGGCEPGNCASSGNQGTANEEITFNGFAGVRYTAVVDGYDGAAGAFTLSTSCPVPVPTGNCVPDDTLTCNTLVQGSTFGAANDVEAWSCAGWETTGGEVVYRITPPVSGEVTIDLFGLAEDIDLFVTTGTPGGQCTPTSCVAVSGNPNAQSEQVRFNATAGTAYYVVADGWNGAASDFQLRATCPGGGPSESDTDTDADADSDADPDTDADDTGEPDDLPVLAPTCGCDGVGAGGMLLAPWIVLAIRRRRRA